MRKEKILLNWAELDLRESIDCGQTYWLRKKADKTSLFEKYILLTPSDHQCTKTNVVRSKNPNQSFGAGCSNEYALLPSILSPSSLYPAACQTTCKKYCLSAAPKNGEKYLSLPVGKTKNNGSDKCRQAIFQPDLSHGRSVITGGA